MEIKVWMPVYTEQDKAKLKHKSSSNDTTQNDVKMNQDTRYTRALSDGTHY
jgi:hypothetical protein